MVHDVPQFMGQFIIIGEDGAAVAIAAQVLGREEGGGADISHGTGLFHRAIAEGKIRPYRLAGILDDIEAMFFCYCHDGFHVGALPEEVHGNNGFRLWCDGFFQCLDVNVKGARFHIHQDRGEFQQGYHLHRGHKSEGYGNDLIVGLQAEGHHGHLQRVGAVGAGDHMFYPQVSLQVFLEALYRRAVNECGGIDHFVDGCIHLGFYLFILRFQVNHPYRSHNQSV